MVQVTRHRLRRSFALVALLGLVPMALTAQRSTGDTIAFGSSRGSYVWLKGVVVSAAHPVAGVVAHRLERAHPGGAWTRVADVSAVSDAASFFALLDSVTAHAVVRALHQQSEAGAWDFIVRFPHADSLSTIIGDDAVRLALGIYGLDPSPRDGESWQYRVSDLDVNGNATAPVTSNVVRFPVEAHFDPVAVARSQGEDSLTIAWWYVGGRKTRTKLLEIWRRQGRTGEFMLYDSVAASIVSGDSLLARSEDRAVTPGAMYQYYAVPRDLFFNHGPSSDTVTIYTVPLALVPMPDSIRARSADTLGIVLTWHVASPDRVRTIKVFRSQAQDTGYVQIAELPSDASRFVDAQVEPMRMYYYRLGMSGLRSIGSPQSSAVFGYYRPALAPEPPLAVRADTAANGFLIRWSATGEANLAGYRVYRTDAPVDSLTDSTTMQLVTGLLPPSDSAVVDSSAELGVGRQYTWVVRAVGADGTESGYSNPATAARSTHEPTPIPVRLSGYAGSRGIVLGWHDMAGIDPLVNGYLVLRQSVKTAASGSAWDTLTKVPLGRTENRYTDSTADRGTWSYVVIAVNVAGERSAPSSAVEVTRSVSLPPPPSGFRALADSAGILLEWDPPADTSAVVRIYRYESGGAASRLGEVAVTELGYRDTGARPGHRYYYYLTTVVAGIEGGAGQERSVRR